MGQTTVVPEQKVEQANLVDNHQPASHRFLIVLRLATAGQAFTALFDPACETHCNFPTPIFGGGQI